MSSRENRSSDRAARASTCRKVLLHACAPTLAALFGGCVSDATLLEENSAVALRSARFQARDDLRCPAAEVTILSDEEVPGAPWGYLYSDYRIRAAGCGRSAVYTVECRDERLCNISRERK